MTDVRKFSRADAEARGWVFAHDSTQLASQPAELRYLRAEKSLNGNMINEIGDDEDQLLERIAWFEDNLVRIGRAEPITPAVQSGEANATPKQPEPGATPSR